MNERQKEIMGILANGGAHYCQSHSHIKCDEYENCSKCQATRIENLFAQDAVASKIMEDALVSVAHLLTEMNKQFTSPIADPIRKLLKKVDNALNQTKESRS